MPTIVSTIVSTVVVERDVQAFTCLRCSVFDVGELAARALVGDVEEHASYHVIVRLGQVKVVSGRTHTRGGGGGGGGRKGGPGGVAG